MDARGGRFISRAKVRYGAITAHACGYDTCVLLYEEWDPRAVNLRTRKETALEGDRDLLAISEHAPLLALHLGKLLYMTS